jgi:deoxyribodipyrimidine photo-lyase
MKEKEASIEEFDRDENISLFWFRRDLRLEDNRALSEALKQSTRVLVLFIFDPDILDKLPQNDARVGFIYQRLEHLNKELQKFGSSLLVLHNNPLNVFDYLADILNINSVYINKDYEPLARERDSRISKFLSARGIAFHQFKDQVIFEEGEVMKADGTPYSVFTPYKKQWLSALSKLGTLTVYPADWSKLIKHQFDFPSLEALGYVRSHIVASDLDFSKLEDYPQLRNLPAMDATSHLSVHLRFGTVSIRRIVDAVKSRHPEFLSELIWREFFMQILFHYPQVVDHNFKRKYDRIKWRNDEEEFRRWISGTTGFPLVDAGMRQLNATGFMHNRVRMVTASFLCKHLLIDWRWGEAYFAEKLLDFELSSNNGNWQWAAGTGCDAAPYFRIFNPTTQLSKFDPEHIYVSRWISELNTIAYPAPMVDHQMARKRALDTYRQGIFDAH